MREKEDWKSEQEKKNKEVSFLLVESEYYQVSSHGEQAESSVLISSLSQAVWYVQYYSIFPVIKGQATLSLSPSNHNGLQLA